MRRAQMTRSCYTLALPDGRRLDLGVRTLVMGIVNVTPDSFSDGGRCLEPAHAIEHALSMEADGADILDIGGESTRPGAHVLPAAEELARVIPVLDGLAGRARVPLSIDTYKAEVAREALGAGASIVNDVSGLLYEPRLAEVVAASAAPLILMHTRGRSREMYRDASYGDVAGEVVAELGHQIRVATDAGVARGQLIVDPGIGFAKKARHSYAVLAGLERLAELARPVLIGPSRKSFLATAKDEGPERREWGTAAAVAAGVLAGAHMVRVHQPGAMRQVVDVADQLQAAAGSKGAATGELT